MADELIQVLGEYAGTFDLEGWLQTLDTDTRVYPAETWPWLKTELVAECRRRGYPVAETLVPANKRIAGLMAGGERFLKGSI